MSVATQAELAALAAMLAVLLCFLVLPIVAALVESFLRRTTDPPPPMKRSFAQLEDPDLEVGMHVDSRVDDPMTTPGSPAPTSPCFANPAPGAGRRVVLLEAQHLIFAAFCSDDLRGVLRVRVGDGYDDGYHRPHQDPHGVIFAAILAIRRDVALAGVRLECPYGVVDLRPRLGVEDSLRVAAATYSTFKMSSNSPPIGNCVGLVALLKHFLPFGKKPVTGDGWKDLMRRYSAVEAQVVSEVPLLHVAVDNPLTHLETDLVQRMQMAGRLSPGVAAAIRASSFFVLGTCLFNPEEDVLEALNTNFSTEQIGQATVRILLSAWYAVEYAGLCYREPLHPRLDAIAKVLLHNVLAPHSRHLRVGNYAVAGGGAGNDGLVRRMLSPVTLSAVSRMYGAS